MNIKKISISKWVIRCILLTSTVICFIPLYFSGITSFKSMNEFYADVWAIPTTFGLENYFESFITGKIGDYFLNSIIITISTVVIIQILAVLCAYALARLKVPRVEIILLCLMAIQTLPAETMVIPLYLIVTKTHIIDVTYLAQILAYVGWSLSGTIIIMKNFFQSIPGELLEAARIDGSGEVNTMFKVILPLMKSAVMTCAVMNFTFAWGELMWAQIATLMTDKGIPLTVGLLNFQGEFGTQWPLLCAAIIMILIPLFLLFAFAQKYFVVGVTSGGVKG